MPKETEVKAGPFQNYGQVLDYARKEMDYVGPSTDEDLKNFLKDYGLIIHQEGDCFFIKEIAD